MPDKAAYEGRLYGFMRSMSELTMQREMGAIINAIAFEQKQPQTLEKALWHEISYMDRCAKERSLSDYKAIALDHLPSISKYLKGK